MQLIEIRDEVALNVQDETFTSAMIDGFINDVYQEVAARCLIPELKGMDVVSTVVSQAYTTLSAVTGGFSGVLSRVYNADNNRISIEPDLESLIAVNGNLSDAGAVEAVALEGNVLWYCQIPAVAEVLTIIYYRNPTELTSDEDSPTVIPDFLHRSILVSGVSAICWNIIEGGIEGIKVNTKSHEFLKENGIVRFREWLGKTRRHYIKAQEPA